MVDRVAGGDGRASVARSVRVGTTTRAESWVKKDRLARGEDSDRARLDPGYVRRLERENAELRMERDVLKRSVVLWVKEATR